MNIVILGLSITSSWGNGHATTFRGLMRALVERGHDVLFLERDVPWYSKNRDLPRPPYGRTELYSDLQDLSDRFARDVKHADLVMLGSYVPEGVAVGEWLLGIVRGTTAFYDIDTPITLAKLENNDFEYISPALIPRFDLYLTFTGGPTLARLEQQYGSPMACPLYCSVDPDLYCPEPLAKQWDLGYLGTYSEDRQPPLDSLMLEAARHMVNGSFVVAGPMYARDIDWPKNVERIEHLPPAQHARFYNAQRFTLNITRLEMRRAGYSPSVRLFEAAACGTPIISDDWPGLKEFFVERREILIARDESDTLHYLKGLSDDQRFEIGRRAREKVLSEHTPSHRAAELEGYVEEVRTRSVSARRFQSLQAASDGIE